MRISLIFLLIFVVPGILNQDVNPFENKYFEILLDRFEEVFENKSILQSQIKVTKVKRVRVGSGWINYLVPFGNDVTMEVKVLKKQGGEYRYLPYRSPQTPFCDGLASDKYVYPDFVKGSNFPPDIASSCPLTGNYTIFNATTDMRNVPSITRIVQSGDYCAEVIIRLNNQVIGTYNVYAFINNV